MLFTGHYTSLEKTSPTQASDSVAKTQPFKLTDNADSERFNGPKAKTKPAAPANPWHAIANSPKAATGNYLKPGNFRLNAVGIPIAMLEKLRESLAIGETLKQVAFAPDKGWVILRDQWGFWCQDVPEAMTKDLWALANKRQEIPYVCQAPNEGYVILRDKPYLLFLDNALPASLRHKLLELYDAEEKIKCVAISAIGGWVVLFGKNGFRSDNIPVDLLNKMYEWGDLDYELKQIAFGPNSGRVLLAGDCGWWHGNIPNGMAEKLREYHEGRKTINSVAISPDSGWVILGN